MDTDIVNTILRLCTEEQKCSFEISFLEDYCRKINQCWNVKYILASMKNYLEIFRINFKQNQMEFFMPFEICRKKCLQHSDDLCSDLHVCYEYFTQNSCRRLTHCSSTHELKEKYHKKILGTLIHLDLDSLSKAFRVYCRINKHSNMENTWRMNSTSQINGNCSWKVSRSPLVHVKTIPKQLIPERGLQICWKPNGEIPRHFIDVIFSNSSKFNGGPIRNYQLYSHLGVAQIFYENSDLVDGILFHGSILFQSFTFIPRLLQRTIDRHRLALNNIPWKNEQIDDFIMKISQPYRITHWEYYQNDQRMIVIEYDRDIDFQHIVANLEHDEESNIDVIQLYLPEVLLVEYDENHSEEEISKWFAKENIFHIKTYRFCSFVHFYSHQDLQQSMKRISSDSIRISPISIDLYSFDHLKNYLQRREAEIQTKNEIFPSISDEDDDDLHDLPSDFDEDDFIFDDQTDTNGDVEFLRNTANNLRSSLTEIKAMSDRNETFTIPFAVSYGDDFVFTVKNRQFAVTFLDYTQFHFERRRNSDRFQLLTSLRKRQTNKNSIEHIQSNTRSIKNKHSKNKNSKHQRKKKHEQSIDS